MFKDLIQPHLEHLMSVSLNKCGNFADAEDLVQETVLTALKYIDNGGNLENPRAWLSTVLTRRYYDMLRRKYQLPTVTIGAEMEIADTSSTELAIISREEAESLRREVAYLARSYRTVIVCHYFKKQSVKEISAALGIPVGTVKSRLDFGRKQIKKGFDTMEKYTVNSYEPQSLTIGISGESALNDEPFSLVEGDMLAQNLLILAYEKPLTVAELSRAIGVATAYVEPIVEKLTEGALMKRTGDGKVYTDFIIFHTNDWCKFINEQESFAENHVDAYVKALESAIKELKSTEFYSERLERFMMIRIAEDALWRVKDGLNFDSFPDRPNGGKWIAFGIMRPQNDGIMSVNKGKEQYMYSGRRVQSLAKYLETVNLELQNYETSLYSYVDSKYSGLGFKSIQEVDISLTKLCYLIKNKIDPERVDLDPRIIKAIPVLEERGFISNGNGKNKVLIPCLSHEQHRRFCGIISRNAEVFASSIKEPLTQYLKTHRKMIPSHLAGVPEDKLSLPYEPNAMMFVYEAINKGVHPRDLGYPCPETIAVFD